MTHTLFYFIWTCVKKLHRRYENSHIRQFPVDPKTCITCINRVLNKLVGEVNQTITSNFASRLFIKKHSL